MAVEYDELRIRLLKTGTNRYLVLANGTHAASAVVMLSRPPGDYSSELRKLLGEEFGQLRGNRQLVAQRLKNLGMELFEQFFPPALHQCLTDNYCSAREQGRELRLKFFPDAELMNIPFEILHSPPNDQHALRFLAFDSRISIVYSLPGRPSDGVGIVRGPEKLRLFIIVSSPDDPLWTKLEPQVEIAKMEEKLNMFRAAGWLSWEIIGGNRGRATRDKLIERLEAVGGKPCAVLMIGHGEYSEEQNQGMVILERENGSADELPDNHFARLLCNAASGLRFVALNLCEGARGASTDLFSGLARSLIAAGIPAVIGMRSGVSDLASAKFSPYLFSYLCQNKWIDEACTLSRVAMARTEEDTTIEWTTPVLFLRRDVTFGWLFNVPQIDPKAKLKAYEETYHLFKSEGGSDTQLKTAIHYEELQGKWKEASDLARLRLDSNENYFNRIYRRGILEQRQADVLEVCAKLAHEEGWSQLRAWESLQNERQVLGSDLVEVLETEIELASKLYRQYEAALRDEKDTRWESAIQRYEQILNQRPSGYRDVLARLEPARRRDGLLKSYKEAKGHEAAENWKEAVRVYDDIVRLYPHSADEYPDIPARTKYAQLRTAEQDGHWETVISLGADLTSVRPDVQDRLSYAQGRIAEAAGDWAASLVAWKGLPGTDDLERRCLAVRENIYRSALEAEKNEQWQSAIDGFRLVLEIQGVQDRLANAERKLDEQCRRAYLNNVAPWMDRLTSSPLVRDPVCPWPGVFPYDALAPAGISPSSSTRDVNSASFVLMEKGLMMNEGRMAWDQLRSVPNRLKVDASMYPLRRLQELQAFQQQVQPVSADEFMRQARETAAEDVPLLLLVSGDWETARSEWEKQQQQHPHNIWVAHALAIAYLNRAGELEDSGSHAEADEFWERAISNWAMLLTDSAYWRSWQASRTACYKEAVGNEEIATLRSELAEQVAEQLTKYADRYQMEGRTERAFSFQQLALAFEVELEGAKALKEVGGLPVNDNEEACLYGGLLFVRHLKFEQTLSKLIFDLDQTVEREAEEVDDVIATLEKALQESTQPRPVVAPQTLLRLRCTFSELGRADVLLERHRYEEVLQALPQEYLLKKMSELPADCAHYQETDANHFATCEHCKKFIRSNPAYASLPYRSVRLFRDVAELAVRSHLAAAETALTSSEPREDAAPDPKFATPLFHWQQAIANSKNAGTQVRTKQAIVRVALGRATALERGRGQQRGRRLTEAIDLLDAVRKLAGGVEEAQINGKQSELLTDRGVWFGYGCHEWESTDYERAKNDLRRAMELNPGSLPACDNMARALVFHASSLPLDSPRVRPLELLFESLSLLDDGFHRFGDSPQLQSALRLALESLEDVVREGQSFNKQLDELDKVLRNLSPDAVVSDIKAIVKSAKQKLQAGDPTSAVLELVRAARLDTANELARHELIAAVRNLIANPFEGGNGHAQGSVN